MLLRVIKQGETSKVLNERLYSEVYLTQCSKLASFVNEKTLCENAEAFSKLIYRQILT